MGICRVCNDATEGINALCYQCQLNLLNEWLPSPKNKNMIFLLADEYKVNKATVMNILRQFGQI